jgi:hypothetical protein
MQKGRPWEITDVELTKKTGLADADRHTDIRCHCSSAAQCHD